MTVFSWSFIKCRDLGLLTSTETVGKLTTATHLRIQVVIKKNNDKTQTNPKHNKEVL